MVNSLFTIKNRFFVVVNNLYTIINKVFTNKKKIFLLIVSKVDMKSNKNLKIGYFCTKPFYTFSLFCHFFSHTFSHLPNRLTL